MSSSGTGSQTLTLQQAYELALSHHQAGRLDPAEQIYRQILATDPDQPDTLHLLGVIEHQRGHHTQALDLITRSLARNPQNVSALSNLGEVHKALEQWEAAQAALEQALALDPQFANALNNLGTIHLRFGRNAQAARCFEQTVLQEPDNAKAHHNLGVTLERLRLRARAIAHFERALALSPDDPEIHFGFACSLSADNRVEEAVVHLQRALELKPDHAQAHGAMSGSLATRLYYTEARDWAARGLALDPRGAGLWAGLAFGQKELGEVQNAVASYRRSVECAPDEPNIHSNLLHTLCFDPATTAADLRAEYERFNARHVAPLRAGWLPHANAPDSARRLRVGYVSPDLRDHAVSHFIAPLLAAHDRAGFEVYCYASGLLTDSVTDRLRALADQWRDVGTLVNEALAAQIRADGIDILVELSLHTADNRLLALARRPAPVQVSWLGYAGSAGVEGIDYHLTDAYLEPPGPPEDAAWPSDEPLRLPDSWICYEPKADAPEVGPLPALGAQAKGAVTFGSLNQGGKHNATVLQLWARILAATPNSRLLLYDPDPPGRQATQSFFESAGVARERVLFAERLSKRACLKVYTELLDVALDPFPHNGMTTTCEALWMGAPVVTLPGRLPVSRAGLSLLSAIGLPELIARDEAHYEQIAIGLATDLPRLAKLRASLRARMQKSPLMDAPRFTRNVEQAYRAIWQRWCQKQNASRK